MLSVRRKPIPMAAHLVCSIGEIVCILIIKMFHVKHIYTDILISLLEKNMAGAAKVTWQQRVCRAIMVSSKGEA